MAAAELEEREYEVGHRRGVRPDHGSRVRRGMVEGVPSQRQVLASSSSASMTVAGGSEATQPR
jgi:hypothetical protein